MPVARAQPQAGRSIRLSGCVPRVGPWRHAQPRRRPLSAEPCVLRAKGKAGRREGGGSHREHYLGGRDKIGGQRGESQNLGDRMEHDSVVCGWTTFIRQAARPPWPAGGVSGRLRDPESASARRFIDGWRVVTAGSEAQVAATVAQRSKVTSRVSVMLAEKRGRSPFAQSSLGIMSVRTGSSVSPGPMLSLSWHRAPAMRTVNLTSRSPS